MLQSVRLITKRWREKQPRWPFVESWCSAFPHSIVIEKLVEVIPSHAIASLAPPPVLSCSQEAYRNDETKTNMKYNLHFRSGEILTHVTAVYP